jgi:hypothetical protein
MTRNLKISILFTTVAASPPRSVFMQDVGLCIGYSSLFDPILFAHRVAWALKMVIGVLPRSVHAVNAHYT